MIIRIAIQGQFHFSRPSKYIVTIAIYNTTRSIVKRKSRQSIQIFEIEVSMNDSFECPYYPTFENQQQYYFFRHFILNAFTYLYFYISIMV